MCFKHRLKRIICSIVLCYFKHFVLKYEYKYALRKMHAKLNELITNLNAHVRI